MEIIIVCTAIAMLCLLNVSFAENSNCARIQIQLVIQGLYTAVRRPFIFPFSKVDGATALQIIVGHLSDWNCYKGKFTLKIA